MRADMLNGTDVELNAYKSCGVLSLQSNLACLSRSPQTERELEQNLLQISAGSFAQLRQHILEKPAQRCLLAMLNACSSWMVEPAENCPLTD